MYQNKPHLFVDEIAVGYGKNLKAKIWILAAVLTFLLELS